MYAANTLFGFRFCPEFEGQVLEYLDSAVASGWLFKDDTYIYSLPTGQQIVMLFNWDSTMIVLAIWGAQIKGPAVEHATDCFVQIEPQQMKFYELDYAESVAALTKIYVDIQPQLDYTDTTQVDIGWCTIIVEKN
jgi:hypothetical protein